jgi:uncharacterized protein Yka (UPF0111/DUF47 family)
MFKLSNLLPRDDKFFRLLGELSRTAHDSANHLKIFVETSDEAARGQASKGIDDCKAAAKRAVAEVTEELCRSYITPFDREDIQDFSTQLYKITKTIEKVRERMQLHGLASHRDDFSRQTDLIVAEAEAMDGMVRDLSKGDIAHVPERVKILHDLELRGDAILGELLVNLFNEGHPTRDLILRKDIYDMLEKVIDRYRDAAGVALEIALKHG